MPKTVSSPRITTKLWSASGFFDSGFFAGSPGLGASAGTPTGFCALRPDCADEAAAPHEASASDAASAAKAAASCDARRRREGTGWVIKFLLVLPVGCRGAALALLAARLADEHAQHDLKLRGGEGLREEDDGARGEAVGRELGVLLGRHHHHGYLHQLLLGLHVADELRPLYVRHHHVEDAGGEVGARLEMLVGVAAVARGDDLVALLLDDGRHQTQDGRVVVGHEDAPRGFCL